MEVNRTELAETVKYEFLHAWYGYKKYAWGHDELKPLSKTYYDWYGDSLCITPIDAFDTMVLMGLKKEIKETKKLIFENFHLDKDFFVSTFEMVIRVVGGFISLYQLEGSKKFLKLAVEVADHLLPSFNSKTGMPYRYVNLKTGELKGKINNSAEIGTLLVEFGTLTNLTGKPIYYNLAKRALVELYNRSSKIGLIGTTINVETGKWINKRCGIGNKQDSYYEYLLKSWLLFGDEDCRKMWKRSFRAINKYLLEKVGKCCWYSQVDMDTGKRISTNFESLSAVFPSIFALSRNLSLAKKMYNSFNNLWSSYDIEPKQINYKTMRIVDATYDLHPEHIESLYYLYHYTKDERYLKIGKKYFENIIKYCKVEGGGFSELKNVITKEKADCMKSFFLAETLKYFYLLFSPKKILEFDKIIFNTEAHPIRRFVCPERNLKEK